MIVKLKVHELLRMPQYQGSTLRGVLGHGLRRASCTNGDIPCEQCTDHKNCPYAKTFHHLERKEEGSFNQVSTPPNPYILFPLDKKCFYQPGEELKFKLTLLGEGIGYIHHFIMALNMVDRFGLGIEKAKVHLDSILAWNGEVIAKEGKIYPDKIVTQVLSTETKLVRKISIHIDTPMRLVQDGKPTSEITFELIMKNILRRAALLSLFYMDKPFKTDIVELLNKAVHIKLTHADTNWEHRQRYSSRQKKKLTIGGFTGDIVFEGELDEFFPWLNLGSIIHVGKGCTLGLGHYELHYK